MDLIAVSEALSSPIESEKSELKALSFYQQELKKLLPLNIFERTPFRASYMISFILLNASLIYFILHFDPAWYWKLACAFFIGQFNAGLAFVAHETLHGSLFKNRYIQDFVG